MIVYKHRIDSLKLKELENIVEEGEEDNGKDVSKALVHSTLEMNVKKIVRKSTVSFITWSK